MINTAASDAILTRLLHLHPKKIDLSLDRLTTLLEKLGNPHRKLPPVIHIAGTNGKGSTTANLRAFAEAAGHRVHVYSSPHLVRFAERIRLAGRLISETYLGEILEEVEAANGKDPITFFEVTTAAAFLAFSRVPADLCILEVGLGGRLDATNVIDEPAACVITPVSFDHEQFLGDTLAAITTEKAGIIKPGVPVICGPQLEIASEIIRETAEAKKAPLILYKDHWTAQTQFDSSGFTYEDMADTLHLPGPVLIGQHQIINAGLSIAAARTQKAVPISTAAIRAGLGWVRWPARLQNLQGSSLHTLLPAGADLWLDGGHNPAAAGVIRTFLQGVNPIDRPIYLILGMMGTKDVEGYLKPLATMVEKVVAVSIAGEDGTAQPSHLAAAATDLGMSGIIAKDVTAALEIVAEGANSKRPPFVLIGGSLYLAGQVLKTAGIYPE